MTVDQEDESRSGSGLALALYDADVATLTLPALPVVDDEDPPFHPSRPATATDVDVVQAARLQLLNEAARRANAYASAIVSHVTANGKARITTGTSAGKVPNPVVAGDPIDPPDSAVLLAIE